MPEEQKQPFVYQLFGTTLGAVVMFFLEILQIVVIAAAIIIPVRYFLVQPFIVKGASMEPNFFENEYLIVDEISYRFAEVQRGDVVVFRPPTGVEDHYIKRVIGLPGDRIQMIESVLHINSEPVKRERIEDFEGATDALDPDTVGGASRAIDAVTKRVGELAARLES